MLDEFFFSNVLENPKNSRLLEELKKFSEGQLKQVYVIDKPLGERKYEYEYKDSVVVLIPKYKILFINFGDDCDEFEDYIEDFIEDLGYISDKYDYKKIIGRQRQWKDNYFEKVNYSQIKHLEITHFLQQYKIGNKEKERNSEFIISLLTGSINDVERVGIGYPETLLDKIKRKIILFDAEQTRFIYKDKPQKRITIQGLAGTGKTELLLQKLKELYVKDKDTKIVFTCHNKILATNLKARIPEFFNFMKVDEQIKWDERLWAVNGWGSQSNPNSGLYSFICNHYKINFYRYSYTNSFDQVCKKALFDLDELTDFEPYFDYILIDESQDFPDSFFELCEKVTKTTIYVAGDIFQNVFDQEIVSSVSPDYLLNKCYRTDPKTLMFAHAVGMGLFEKKLRWLSDQEWEACGYIINKENGFYNLSRKPLRRFEDLENDDVDSVKLILEDPARYCDRVISILEGIIQDNPTVKPDDIGIVFLENLNINYRLADELRVMIKEQFEWEVNLGYETKTKVKDKLFISNINNVKGLEFPFVICVARRDLGKSLRARNSVYMMLTRSFLTTYFIMSNTNEELFKIFNEGLIQINRDGILSVIEPSALEQKVLRNAIIDNNKVSQSIYDFIEGIFDDLDVVTEKREKLHKMLKPLLEEEVDELTIREFIKVTSKII